MNLTRRTFLQIAGGTAASPVLGLTAQPPESWDLLIAGGRVIDPARQMDGVMDVAVTGGRIARVASNLPRRSARQVVDAAGRVVTPGLIDLHGHVYDSAIPTSIDPDLVGIPKGVTTIVDAGSTGAFTFPGFRKHVIERAQTRIYAFLNLSAIGLVVNNETYIDPKLLDVAAAVKTIQDNRDRILGLKVRITGRDENVPYDIEALKKGREIADATGVPIMLHWTNERKLLDLLKRGDIVVHPFNPPRSGPSLLGPDFKVLPQILELRDRGIFTDFAHGTHLLWETAETAAQQGWYPDTISTDVHRAHVGPNGVVQDLVTTLSKFMLLGLSLSQAIERVTANPAKILKFPEKLGSLDAGNPADISIFTVSRGEFEVLDSARQKRIARDRISPFATVRGGRLTTV